MRSALQIVQHSVMAALWLALGLLLGLSLLGAFGLVSALAAGLTLIISFCLQASERPAPVQRLPAEAAVSAPAALTLPQSRKPPSAAVLALRSYQSNEQSSYIPCDR